MGKKKGTKKSAKSAKNKGKKVKKSKKVPAIKPEVIEPEPQAPPPFQGEFICIHIGQAGVEVGSACWELFCVEHGINPDGTVNELSTNSPSMFSLSQADGTFVPRALLVDTEPSVIDGIKNGNYQKLFCAENMICGKESAASNYAAGFYGIGKKLMPTVMNRLTRLAEDCNSLQGIALFRSMGGGTGSGMGSRVIETIKNAYPNKTIIDFNVYSPSQVAPAIVEPYNVALTVHHNLDMVNCSMLFNNKSLYDICTSKLNLPKPTYRNINSIIALVTSGITSSLRYEGSMMSNISELLTNLIPQPRLHYPLVTYAPIADRAEHVSSACTQLAAMSFDHDSQMIDIDPMLGKCQSVCMMFRGNLKPTEINTAIAFVQREQTIPLVQNLESPLFKFGLCYEPPVAVPRSGIFAPARSVTTLCNTTAVKQCWTTLMEGYNRLLSKRAYVHHYAQEGMDEGIFGAANGSVSQLIAEYEEIDNS